MSSSNNSQSRGKLDVNPTNIVNSVNARSMSILEYNCLLSLTFAFQSTHSLVSQTVKLSVGWVSGKCQYLKLKRNSKAQSSLDTSMQPINDFLVERGKVCNFAFTATDRGE